PAETRWAIQSRREDGCEEGSRAGRSKGDEENRSQESAGEEDADQETRVEERQASQENRRQEENRDPQAGRVVTQSPRGRSARRKPHSWIRH
ncbi:MAG TPA: hypothetical protein VH375_06930, partial [Rhodanobacteraceae bacterium]